MRITNTDLIVAISQYKAYEYTARCLVSLHRDSIPMTTLLLSDGSPIRNLERMQYYYNIIIHIKKGIHSLPELWNLMFGCAKLTEAKYLLWSGCDMEFRAGSLRSMMQYINDYDVVSPIKIDNDVNKFHEYKPEGEIVVDAIGCNDSVALFNLEKMPFNVFNKQYGPYQFEISAAAFELWKNGCTFCIDKNAVVFHHCNKDIEYSPEVRKDSSNWDKKRDYFLANNGDAGKWFCEHSIMNSESVKEFGFPVYTHNKERISNLTNIFFSK